jgi:hypothetical protein
VSGQPLNVPGASAADRPREPSDVGRRERYGLLLAAIVVAFALQGVSTPTEGEQIFISLLLGLILLLAAWTAEAKPWVMRLTAALVVALVVAGVVEAVNGAPGQGATRVESALLVVLGPPWIILGVVRSLRAKQAVTLEAVFGVLCIYLLLGMFFSFVYGSIDRLGGAPFFAGGQPATVSNCMYFSFATLTTVGYGDLTARANLGHTLSVSEALLGQIYLVTIVSLIVANLGRGRPASPQG